MRMRGQFVLPAILTTYRQNKGAHFPQKPLKTVCFLYGHTYLVAFALSAMFSVFFIIILLKN